ncbi:hypothetical protein IFM89_011867 [Coptis chinensis]|uniref:TF-B3 domain-containing protein n=1 Tax=Coptis chinensis TaxID=261450 RepID=A0A835LZH5_9MAGN|nr:hypothetical protein IFM89_011867 [Coptis chinensis]
MQKPKRREEKEECYQRRKEEKGSHFFKIIHSTCTEDGRLAIPQKFTRNFGKELSSTVVLKVPSGKEWNVQLKEDEGLVWFQKGWDAFVEYHSICVGHLLVFRYEGKSLFSVVICDMSASEIEYPCDSDDLEEPDFETGSETSSELENQEDDSVEILDNGNEENRPQWERSNAHIVVDKISQVVLPNFYCRGNGEPTMGPLRSFRSRWVDNKNMLLTKNMDSEQDFVPCAYDMQRPTEFVADRETTNIKQQDCELFGSIFKRVAEGGEVGCIYLNNNELTSPAPPKYTFRRPSCDDPYHLKNVEGPQESYSSFVYSGVPSNGGNIAHSKTVGVDANCSTKQEVRISDSSIVCMKRQGENVSGPRRLVSLREKERGIIPARAFTPENPLSTVTMGRSYVQGTCILYLPNILAKTCAVSVTGRFLEAQEKTRAIIARTGFSSDNPFCVVTMRPTYVSGNFSLNLPTAFAKKYLKESQGIILRISNGGMWYTRRQGEESRKLGNGWRAFVLDNQLKEDDVCIFELVDRKHLELKVLMFRELQHVLMSS